MIEDRFDVPFVADLAFREKQIQQNYRPVIGVHKWFARRPGSLFRSLLISEFGSEPLRRSYARAQSFEGKVVFDPFMGGGTPVIEANRVGCDTIGNDLNPMAYWIVSQELASLDLAEYANAADNLRSQLEKDLGHLYRTQCLRCADQAVVKYFLWVKTTPCPSCSATVRLLPSNLIAKNQRHPLYVLACGACGELNETPTLEPLGPCSRCNTPLTQRCAERKNHFLCQSCNTEFKRAPGSNVPLDHAMLAIEYHCPGCRASTSFRGRSFKAPDEHDLANFDESRARLAALRPEFIPDSEIPVGDETKRLHRWGYNRFSQLFNDRQLLGLELSARLIAQEKSELVKHALATNLSDLLRYQNLLCRYDTMALKALDIFSVHGFPVGLIQCESNLLGIPGATPTGLSVGSGGWKNITEKYLKAKSYCTSPFEVIFVDGRKTTVPVTGETISTEGKRVELSCRDSSTLDLAEDTVDAVLTDPPYYGNVQYAELMDFCYVWLKKLLGGSVPAFARDYSGCATELTANETSGKGAPHFTEGLARTYSRAAKAMKPEGVFAFTYHHNRIEAYLPVAVALLDAGLACTKAIPCPAEMGGSIHINGTASSIIDTVFVCRKKAHPRALEAMGTVSPAIDRTSADISLLLEASLRISIGDIRCVLFGNVIAIVVNSLACHWDASADTAAKLENVRKGSQDHLSGDSNQRAMEIASSLHEKLVVTNGHSRSSPASTGGALESAGRTCGTCSLLRKARYSRLPRLIS